MKTCKRLFAAAMVVLMALTIMPANMLAFATGGTGSDTDPFTISTIADLKEVLEGLGSAAYPADAFYELTNDIDPVHEWVFASEENSLKAAEDLNLNEVEIPATYVEYTDTRPTSPDGYYVFDGENYIAATQENVDDDTITLYVIDTPASSDRTPITGEQFAALSQDDRDDLVSANNIEIPTITPADVSFSGVFDGNGTTIRCLNIECSGRQGAMFLTIAKEGTVKDFTLAEDCTITLSSVLDSNLSLVGSVAGLNDGKITGITSNATVNAAVKLPEALFTCVGGIAGAHGSADNGAEITNCTFGGKINFNVAEESFDGTPDLSEIDVSYIMIGGVAGRAETAVTGFTGTQDDIKTNFIGGQYEKINQYCVCDDTTGADYTIELQETDKKVNNKDEAYYSDFTDATEPDDNGYQLVSKTNADSTKTYYIRWVVCPHANLEHFDAVPETCSADGTREYWHCADCDRYYIIEPTNISTPPANYKIDIVVPKSKTHQTAEHHDKVNATCTTDGNEEYWYCPVCGKYFLKDPINNESVASYASADAAKIKAKGHSYEYQKLDGNDTQHKKLCKNCNEVWTEDHNYGSWSNKNDTQHHRTCKNCKYEQVEDHSFGAWTDYTTKQHKATCDVCGTTKKEDHNFGAWEKYNDKQHKAVCADCQREKTDNHSFGKWQKYNETNHVRYCTECNEDEFAKHSFGSWKKYDDKQHVRYCKECNEDNYADHDFDNGKVTKPTTTSKGYTTYTCKTCGYSYKDNYTDPIPSSVIPKDGTGYSKDDTGKYLITALPTKKAGITVSTFKKNLKSDSRGYVVRDEKGNEVTSGNVRTGYTVEIKGFPETKVTIVVKGDANKDGKISALDYVKVKNHILKKVNLKKDMAAFLAADANGDGKISALDYVKIKNLILKG